MLLGLVHFIVELELAQLPVSLTFYSSDEDSLPWRPLKNRVDEGPTFVKCSKLIFCQNLDMILADQDVAQCPIQLCIGRFQR
jgi:hypothetical protein